VPVKETIPRTGVPLGTRQIGQKKSIKQLKKATETRRNRAKRRRCEEVITVLFMFLFFLLLF